MKMNFEESNIDLNEYNPNVLSFILVEYFWSTFIIFIMLEILSHCSVNHVKSA